MQSLKSFNCNLLLNIVAQYFSFELFKTSQIKYYKYCVFIFHIRLPFCFLMLPSCIENCPAILSSSGHTLLEVPLVEVCWG